MIWEPAAPGLRGIYRYGRQLMAAELALGADDHQDHQCEGGDGAS
jgi:hypothetical protein